MSSRKLATLYSLKSLGEYYKFDFTKDVEGDFTKAYCYAKKEKKLFYWLVRPVGTSRRSDIDSDMFYVKAREGFVGILYRARIDDGTYRIVFFVRPLKRIPRVNRKYSAKKSSNRSH